MIHWLISGAFEYFSRKADRKFIINKINSMIKYAKLFDQKEQEQNKEAN